MEFSLKDVATTAAKNFINKKLQNVNLATGALGALNGLQNSLPGIPGLGGGNMLGMGGATTPPIPGKVSEDDTSRNQYIDINGELAIGKDLAYIERKPGEAFPNELDEFNSYNCIFTLSVLSGVAINFPDDTYRRGILGPIIVKSGGTGDVPNSNAIKLKNFKSNANPSGRFDSFIDNVKISGIMGFNKATGNTNSTSISFQIIEPYSTGLFFQTVQVAAFEAGWKNWLDMPILLTIEFKGHLTANQQNIRANLSRKYIPLKLREISMKITGQGTVYQCESYPWNEKAYSTDINQLKTDKGIEGNTVQQMLQTGTKENKNSLQNLINESYEELAKEKGIDPDKVLILFPVDLQTGKNATNTDDRRDPPTATVKSPAASSKENDKFIYAKLGVEDEKLHQKENVNPIGMSKIGFGDDVKKAEAAFGKEDIVYDEKTGTFTRGNLQLKKNTGIAKFATGTSVTDAINEIILGSDYGRQALDPKNIDENNKVTWWRIETQCYILSTSKKLKGDARYPTLSVYRVIPFKIDYTNFVPGGQPAKKIEEKKMNAVKKYEYLYTGKNTDILDFSIDFKTSFYQALNADGGANNESVQQNLREEDDANNGQETDAEFDAADIFGASKLDSDETNFTPGQTPTKVITRHSETSMNSQRGGITAGEYYSTIAARQFNKAINTGVDMISLNMKILGDPYYIADSGVGNYTAQATNVPEMNSDGAMNTHDGEVYITVNFRNPIDLNPNEGLYDFGGKGKIVPEFSGLFQVLQVESSFEKNVFTQQLKLIRMLNQDLKPTESSNNAPAKSAFTPNDSYDGVEGGP
jgi:hypothetical protein